MSVATLKLSSKGQVVIPKEIRSQLHWDTGAELILVTNDSGITLKTKPKKTGRTLANLIGMLHHEGEPVSTEELCRTVDYSKDWGKQDIES